VKGPVFYIRVKEILRVLPISRATWYRGIQSGIFPKPFKMGRVSVWDADEILKLPVTLQTSMRSEDKMR
jgi:predicted DNA-binding transcriptional regulator AlpA